MKNLIAAVLMSLLANCGGLPKAGHQAALYDFGITPLAAPVVKIPVGLAKIETAPGLEGSEMRYRLAYQNPARVLAFTESRWVAPPDKLFAGRIAQRLHPTPAAQCLLHIELETFDQVFDAPDTSNGIVQLQAMLTTGRSKSPMAQIRIEKVVKSRSADARGGVEALTAATDEAITSVLDWAKGASCNPPVP